MLNNEDLNILIAVHIFEDHTWESIEEIRQILLRMGDIDCTEAEEVWAENGVIDYSVEIDLAFMALEEVGFAWSMDHKNGCTLVTVQHEGLQYKSSGPNIARVVCEAVLLAIGVISEEQVGEPSMGNVNTLLRAVE